MTEMAVKMLPPTLMGGEASALSGFVAEFVSGFVVKFVSGFVVEFVSGFAIAFASVSLFVAASCLNNSVPPAYGFT